MTDFQTFPTRKMAQQEIDRMRGWNAKPVRLYLPEDKNAGRAGHVWVIGCERPYKGADRMYLRTDGYVR